MVGIAASPASAAAVQSCAKVTGTITMKPGLGTAAKDQTVTIKGAESGCKPTATSGGTGSFVSVFKLKQASCGTLLQGGSKFTGPATTTWKNRKTTTYSVTYKDGTGNNVTIINMTGKATKGLFAGKKFNAGLNIDINSAKGDCTSTPFTSAKWKQTKAWSLS